ncbi:ceramide kinase-like protein [Littorina saxatilis]|uniref:DAGKc domain-containing protein n=1 Tax=Littorina saxatilis TaxID=31220 RepID=A0AAN9BMY6_9CAEN
MDDNVSYTFDDEGNPISTELPPPSARKPPAAPRKGRSKQRKLASAGSQESALNNGATPDLATPSSCQLVAKGEEPMTDMFHIDGTGFDVTLSPNLEKIYWESMNPSGPSRKRSGSLSGLFRRRKSSSGLKDPNQDSIDMNKLFGVRIKRRRKAGQGEEEGFVLGLGLFTFEQKDVSILREKEIYFEHPSVEICTRWSDKLNTYLNSSEGRPKNVKIFLQAYAGEKNGRNIYKNKILPLFQNAGIAVDMTVIHHNEHVKQDMIHLNIDDFDCVIAMGGDGTVNQVLNGLMNRAQKEKDIEKRSGFSPANAPIPMGVIPIGKTNHVAFSLMGTADPVTATLHIIFGNWSPVDICSVYTTEKFHRWAFNCQYGFAGNMLTFMKRYASLGAKRIDAAFLKALTSSKLRAYDCDIEYIPASKSANPKSKTICRRGCDVCVGRRATGNSQAEVITDMVQELDLNNSISSRESAGSVIELKQDSPWRTLKGDFMNVSIYAIPGNCEIAPQGLSKYTHLNDGNMDVVAVKSVQRKDFIRFLSRHGNSKDQFEFPFVEVIRCKEVKFRPRIQKSWEHADHEFSEIKYQMTQQQMQKKKLQRHRSMEMVIDDLESSQSRPPALAFQDKSRSMYDLDVSDEDDDEEDEEKDGDGDLGAGHLKGRGGSSEEGQSKGETVAMGREGSEPSKFQYVGPQYQPTWTDQEIARRKKIARKKEEKKKAKEDEKSRSVWNIDNEICKTLELDFRVHNGLLLVCGLGISPHAEFNDVRFGCLPA